MNETCGNGSPRTYLPAQVRTPVQTCEGWGNGNGTFKITHDHQERVMKRFYISTAFSAIALAGVVDSALATTVYRWTDERGTVNYSNERPKGRAPKDLHVIEDRVSVYTPEKLPERIRYIPTPPGTGVPQWYGTPAS